MCYKFNLCINTFIDLYRFANTPGDNKSLARPTSRCIFSMFRIFLLMLVLIYRVSQEECARLREDVPYVKVYRYNPKHLCPKLNGYVDNGQRKLWSSCGSTYCTWTTHKYDSSPIHMSSKRLFILDVLRRKI